MSYNAKIAKITINISFILCLIFCFSCSGNSRLEEKIDSRPVYSPNDPTNSYYQVPSGIQQYQQNPYQPPYQQQRQQYYQQPYVPPTYAVPASRYYSNPYAIPPSTVYQRYDADQYYVPPNYYQNIERQQPANRNPIQSEKY